MTKNALKDVHSVVMDNIASGKAVWNIELRDSSPFYETFSYPAGEVQLRIKPEYQDWVGGKVRIVSRDTSGNGLLRLTLLASALYGLNPLCEIELVFPYLPYGRADRRFVPGDCHGLGAFASIVNQIGARKVITLDAHSKVASQMIMRLEDVSAKNLIVRAISRWAERHGLKQVVVLFPDKGALDRYGYVPDELGPLQIIKLACQKQRDPVTGIVNGVQVPGFPGEACVGDWNRAAQYALVVDDICDGGATFLGIAKEIPAIKLGLYVTHGIFSKGFEKLHEAFDAIYTTDSVKDVSSLDAAVFNAEAECRTR